MFSVVKNFLSSCKKVLVEVYRYVRINFIIESVFFYPILQEILS